MFDDFREQAEDSFFDDEDDDYEEGGFPINTSKIQGVIFGMTPTQRFVILALLLIVICLGSVLCLLVTGSITPPFP